MSWQTLSSNLPYGSLAVAVAADGKDDDDFDEDHDKDITIAGPSVE